MKKYRLNSAVDIIGAFWPPDNPNDFTTGSLSSRDNHLYFIAAPVFKQKLTDEELLRQFDAWALSRDWKEINVLKGESREGRCTLLHLVEHTSDGLVDHAKRSEISAAHWRVGSAIIGLHLESNESEDLDGAAFYLSKIKNLLPRADSIRLTQEGMTRVAPLQARNYFSFSSIEL
jgi:hypothetical protein